MLNPAREVLALTGEDFRSHWPGRQLAPKLKSTFLKNKFIHHY